MYVEQFVMMSFYFQFQLSLNIYLRNEFHFSDVHGAMNRSGSRAK